MLILIDGYNLIGTQRGDLGRARQELIESIIAYRAARPHSITLVFDGYIDGMHESSSVRGSVRVMFTGIGERADSAILRLIPAGTEVLVVSSDREVQAGAWARGAVALGSEEFIKRALVSGGGADDYEDSDEDAQYERLYGPSRGSSGARKLSKKEKALGRALGKL